MRPEDLRADIPALEETVYLNTGASGPSPRRVVEAAHGAVESHAYDAPGGEGMYPAAAAEFEATREAVADHLGADPDTVALTASTTDAIAQVAGAIQWAPGDVVVRTDLEHAAGILPWRRLREKHGVDVRVLETADGRVDPEDYAEAVDGARLVVFSSLTWTHGTRLPVGELVDVAHDAGARVLVDAVQSVGQHPVDVREWGADAVAGAGHKWLLNLHGAGYLYVEPEFCRTLEPARVGYRSVVDPYADPYELEPGARRFEVGTTAVGPFAGLREGVAIVEELGYDTITDHVGRLTDRLTAGVPADRLRSPESAESGLVAVTVEDAERTVQRAADAGVVVRSLPTDGVVRASVHAFNTAEDIDALLDVLRW